MSAKENLANTFGTFMTIDIAIIWGAFIPYNIVRCWYDRMRTAPRRRGDIRLNKKPNWVQPLSGKP